MKLGSSPKAHSYEQIQRNRFLDLIGAAEAVRPAVARREARVILNDESILDMPVPGLVLRITDIGRIGCGYCIFIRGCSDREDQTTRDYRQQKFHAGERAETI